ncbi:transposable element Tcb1 transposase [Trichonephila clavipes]|nr:transposable element Tcb1 transposase [Trichonephila clavipes]
MDSIKPLKPRTIEHRCCACETLLENHKRKRTGDKQQQQKRNTKNRLTFRLDEWQVDKREADYTRRRPRITTPNEERYLAVTAKGNRRSTASDLSRQLSSATGTTISRQTVYRRLGRIALYARRPDRCVPLTATHCRL